MRKSIRNNFLTIGNSFVDMVLDSRFEVWGLLALIGWLVASAEIFHQCLGKVFDFKGLGQKIIHTTL